MERLVCLITGYVFGLFQTGYIYGKINHIDIRQHGSGNAGTTNALRTLGLKAGTVTFLGDFMKCILAVAVVRLLYGKTAGASMDLYAMYAGLGAVLGHNFPFYLKFKGGKGIAATAGLMAAVNPRAAVIAMISFLVIVAVTRYVSLASIVLVIIFAVGMIVRGEILGTAMTRAENYEIYALAVFLALLGIYRHRENIKRLLNGTENKFGSKKK